MGAQFVPVGRRCANSRRRRRIFAGGCRTEWAVPERSPTMLASSKASSKMRAGSVQKNGVGLIKAGERKACVARRRALQAHHESMAQAEHQDGSNSPSRGSSAEVRHPARDVVNQLKQVHGRTRILSACWRRSAPPDRQQQQRGPAGPSLSEAPGHRRPRFRTAPTNKHTGANTFDTLTGNVHLRNDGLPMSRLTARVADCDRQLGRPPSRHSVVQALFAPCPASIVRSARGSCSFRAGGRPALAAGVAHGASGGCRA